MASGIPNIQLTPTASKLLPVAQRWNSEPMKRAFPRISVFGSRMIQSVSNAITGAAITGSHGLSPDEGLPFLFKEQDCRRSENEVSVRSREHRKSEEHRREKTLMPPLLFLPGS